MVDFGMITGTVINAGAMILAIIVTGAMIVGLIFFYRRYKRYSQYEIRIWGKDAFGQLTESKDKGGIFVDTKTKNKRLFLQKNNVGLDPDNVPVIYSGSSKIVYLRQDGLKNFTFIKPILSSDKFQIEVGEEDVNWAVNAYERQKKMFNQNMLMQYLPFISLAFVSIIILIMFIYFFKNFDTLKAVASAMENAATQLSNPNLIQ